MAIVNSVFTQNLGAEFDLGAIVSDKISLKIGQGLQRLPDGSISVNLSVQTLPLYEYREMWAEEGGGTNPNTSEWSYGNGSVGFIGLPIGTNWELIEIGFHADTYAATATIQVDVMNYGNVASNAAANTIGSINLANSTDGGGTTNNAYKLFELATPIPVPVTGTTTVVGFITRGETGNISDARVYARFRRQIGNYVSGITLL